VNSGGSRVAPSRSSIAGRKGRPERYAEIAAEFVRLKVDVIVTNGSAAPTVRQATSVIPIIFPMGIDPVGGGLITNLARPGGNVTGLSVQQTDLAGKRLEFLREVVPRLRRLAIMFDVGFPQAELEMGEAQATARTLGIEVAPLEIRRAEDIAPVFEAQARVDALYVVVNALVVANRTRIITLALGARLPTIFNTREFVHAGGLMSYGPNYPDLFSAHRRVGRQDSARDEARRHPGRAADQIRVRPQSHDR